MLSHILIVLGRVLHEHVIELDCVNKVKLCPIYINVVDSVFPQGILLNIIMHVFYILNERLLALSQSKNICISMLFHCLQILLCYK